MKKGLQLLTDESLIKLRDDWLSCDKTIGHNEKNSIIEVFKIELEMTKRGLPIT